MSMPLSPTKLFVCDGCGATLPLAGTNRGQKCRCGGCGKILIVPGIEEEPEAAVSAVPEVPETVGFFCRVCDTRIVARTGDVGKKAKCPDCWAMTVIPPPPKVRPKKPPAAMHGQQYGLWDVDEAPLPKDLAARQPKFFPVYCRVCDTLMHAQLKQVGTKLTCPDCGGKTVVLPPPKEKPRPDVLVPDGEEYQLDKTHIPPTRPVIVSQAARNRQYREESGEEQLRQEYYERPQLPGNPLLEGVFRMLVRSPLPECIFVFAFALALEVWFIANAMANVSGLAMAIVLMSYAVTAVFGLLSFGAASAFWVGVLTESSEGNDKLYNPPGPVFLDWVGNFFYVAFAFCLAVAPGCLAWRFIPQLPFGVGPLLADLGCVLLFPIFLLSQLENGSALEFFSPKLVRSLIKRPGPWLLFYVESTLLIAGCGAAVVGLQVLSGWLIIASVLLLSGTSFLYFRLLGRLAWWLAETITDDDDLPDAETP